MPFARYVRIYLCMYVYISIYMIVKSPQVVGPCVPMRFASCLPVDNRSRCPLGYKPCEHRKIESGLILSCGVHRAYSQVDKWTSATIITEALVFDSWRGTSVLCQGQGARARGRRVSLSTKSSSMCWLLSSVCIWSSSTCCRGGFAFS